MCIITGVNVCTVNVTKCENIPFQGSLTRHSPLLVSPRSPVASQIALRRSWAEVTLHTTYSENNFEDSFYNIVG